MVCEHLSELEKMLIEAGVAETARGSVWSQNCREWVYFDCILDLASLRQRLRLSDFIEDHEHRGTHDGSELGFFCSRCQDGIMGIHPSAAKRPVFR